MQLVAIGLLQFTLMDRGSGSVSRDDYCSGVVVDRQVKDYADVDLAHVKVEPKLQRLDM